MPLGWMARIGAATAKLYLARLTEDNRSGVKIGLVKGLSRLSQSGT